MADFQAILDEEFEVLESIFPDELEKLGPTQVRIRVEPEEEVTGHPLCAALVVSYPPTYPDVIPDLALEETDVGELRDGEADAVVAQLNGVAEESLGMAMTFTLATAAREALSALIVARQVREKEEDDARTRAYEEAEAAKTKGTPVTRESYEKWRTAFLAELAARRTKDEEERVRSLPAKEREEVKRKIARPSGRQLFETSKVSATSDEALYEDGEAVDMSKYTREERDRARWGSEDEGRVKLDESDSE
ncbi:RWD-domain-containing protein [Cutaneotrichosporon oleaginosum]|uniref:RWD-domain-containing protein n=1 Tax=Cutaneotrichosporon oleaginosum TaxID=879819 RepID=A0A0J0XBX7_9TREE|nr:RWD-domain-containing protein [Cutaneotrichosporon oleaginosum]KLT38576.1 RWD-domain-containing protein [Cutaneotrichosporon oleaginosum]